MLIFPAIDLYEGCAVRLYKGDYAQKTVYSEHPLEVAEAFRNAGASCIHLVDLEGARSGTTPNLELILKIKKTSGLFAEVGGGIRNMEPVRRYLEAGIDRVILGTAAVTDPAFAEQAVSEYGERVAIGIDLRDGCVATHGWTENSGIKAEDFCRRMQSIGVKTMICTDISKDGAMQGTNRALYKNLSEQFSMRIVASGGVSSLEDIRALRELDLYGAILGKAYYTGAVDLKQALEAAK